MKKIYLMLLAMVTAALTFTSCSDDDPFYTAGENDTPRFLNTEFNGDEIKDGQAYPLTKIFRSSNFNFTAKVTPVQYTTVTWEIDGKPVSWEVDGEMVSEGETIDIPLLAGTHNVKIIATTTKGKQTWRNCTLTVEPLDGDPALSQDAKPRWLAPGSKAKISGVNLDNVTSITINGEDVPDFVNAGSYVTFSIPAELLPEGETKAIYELVLNTTDEEIYGGGLITVTTEDYPAVTVDVVLINESCTPGWDTNTEAVGMADLINAGYIQPGAVMTIEFSDVAEGCVIAPINSEWASALNGKWDPDRADLHPAVGETSATIVLDEVAIEAMKKGLFFAGQNYTLNKVSVEATLGNDVVLLDTPCAPAWDQNNQIAIMRNLMNWGLVPVGSTIVLELSDVVDGCVIAPINDDWASAVNGKWDPDRADIHPEIGATSATIEIDEAAIEAMKKGLYFAGQNYTLNKVTLKY